MDCRAVGSAPFRSRIVRWILSWCDGRYVVLHGVRLYAKMSRVGAASANGYSVDCRSIDGYVDNYLQTSGLWVYIHFRSKPYCAFISMLSVPCIVIGDQRNVQCYNICSRNITCLSTLSFTNSDFSLCHIDILGMCVWQSCLRDAIIRYSELAFRPGGRNVAAHPA